MSSEMAPPTTGERYAAAERALPFNLSSGATHAAPAVHWTPSDDCLVLRTGGRGWEIIRVSGLDSGSQTILTATGAAESIEAASASRVAPSSFHQARVRMGDQEAHVRVGDICWRVSYAGRQVTECGEPVDGVVSPDQTLKAYARDQNIWLWDYQTGRARALTTDGSPEATYGLQPDTGRMTILHRRLGRPPQAVVVWSPDSSWLGTHTLHQDGVETMTLVESTPCPDGRPVDHTYAYSVPGDGTVPWARLVLLEVGGDRRVVSHPDSYPAPHHAPQADSNSWWSAGCFYYLIRSRDFHDLELHGLDAASGRHRVVHREHSPTWVDAGPFPTEPPLARVLADTQQFIWFSTAETPGSLYLHDLDTGARIRRIGREDHLPVSILSVDETTRSMTVAISNVDVDPYKQQLARLYLDSQRCDLLVNDGLDHRLRASPSGRRIFDVMSDVATPPNVVVRDGDGAVVASVPDTGAGVAYEPEWCLSPERVRLLAADGATPIFGTLYRPMGFDPDQAYPLVDYLYPGPQVGISSPCHWSVSPKNEHALAALGFVVLTLDARGTPGRGKPFHDSQYQVTQKAGYLEDHVAAINQLRDTHPFIDIERVASIGHSGGGYAAFRALALYPDTYKVAVATAGDHDQRYYTSQWLERWHGADGSTYGGITNADLADRVRGEIFLAHGELDDNVAPTQTLRLVDALIAKNKDFDLLIVPGAEHALAGHEGYVLRRSWDFLVRSLLDVSPAAGYKVAEPPLEHYWSRI
jgi:dipeptidyl-peptidase-4